MKDYEETFKDILKKINKYEDVKKSKKKIMIKWVVSICCVCAIAMIGIGVWKSGLIRISRFNPSDDQDSGLQETTEPAFQVVKKRPDAPIIWAEELPYGPEYKDWNGKDVEGFLYDALVDDKNRGQYIAVEISVKRKDGFLYNGKTLDELRIEADNEILFNNRIGLLEKMGDSLKYGEALINEGSPDGERWAPEYYYSTIERIGKDLVDKYIVDGEFLRDKLAEDYPEELAMKRNNEYNAAIEASFGVYVDEIVEQMEQLNIYYERRIERKIIIFVTADEFASLNIQNAMHYDLALEKEIT